MLVRPEHGDVQSRPYLERRALLLDVLEEAGPPLQAVPATDDRATALLWYDALREQGVEGLVAKHATSPYRAAGIWKRVRHADTMDTLVVGYTGSASRPRALAVRLPDNRIALSSRSAHCSRHKWQHTWPARAARTDSGCRTSWWTPARWACAGRDDQARGGDGHPVAVNQTQAPRRRERTTARRS
ncbi:hypothetical protein AB0A60_19370 [Streptomyces sp. NPDC046275]|uniref:hypothetical protein n=1 Tax=Streptomyces sp. NPDC046275 TaxID=3157201 RepID=UPI0033FF0540